MDIVILILILVFVFLCILVYFYTKPKSTPIPTTTKTHVAQEKINTAPQEEDGFSLLINAYENGEEAAVLELANIYMHGLHPFYAPNKLEAARICQFIVYNDHFSRYAKQKAKDLFKEVKYEVDYDAKGAQFPQDPVKILERIKVVNIVPIPVISPQIQTRVPQPHINYNDYLFDDNDFVNDLVPNANDTIQNDTIQNDIFQNDTQVVLNNPIANDTPVIANDTQNVHSSSVQNMALTRLQQIEKPYITSTPFIIPHEISAKEKYKINRVIRSLSDSKHSRYDKSEQEIFDIVWNRINDPVNAPQREEMIKIFAQNLASGIEHDNVVCSTGKIVRMLGSLDAIDTELTPLKPEWAIDNEMATTASRIRDRVLQAASPVQQEDYNAGKDTTLEEQMKAELHQALTTDYVNTNILSKEIVDLKCETLALGF